MGANTRGQFHQRFTCSFYALRSQKHKNSVKLSVSYMLSGSAFVKAARRTLMKLSVDRELNLFFAFPLSIII